MDIDRIPKSDFPKNILPTLAQIERMAGLVKEASIPAKEYLSIASVANAHAMHHGARRDGKLVYCGILLKKFEGV